MRLSGFIKKYFDKNVLPYWVIVLMDMAIVFVSAVFTYWVINRTLMAVEHHRALVFTAVIYSLLSLVGARLFMTYAGVALFEFCGSCQTGICQRYKPCACPGLLAGDELDGDDMAVCVAATGNGGGVFDCNAADVGVTTAG